MATKIGMEFPTGPTQENSEARNTFIESSAEKTVEKPVRKIIELPARFEEMRAPLMKMSEEWSRRAESLRQSNEQRNAARITQMVGYESQSLEGKTEMLKKNELGLEEERAMREDTKRVIQFAANALSIKKILEMMDPNGKKDKNGNVLPRREPDHGLVESTIDGLKKEIKNTTDPSQVAQYEEMVNWLAALPTFSTEDEITPLRGIEKPNVEQQQAA